MEDQNKSAVDSANEEKREEDINRYIEFNIGHESYAVGLLSVLEVTSVPKTTPVPNSPPYMVGLMNLRGKIVSIVDAREKMSIEKMEDSSQEAVIILRVHDGHVGIIVDSINKVLQVDSSQIESAVDVKKQSNAQYIDGIYQHKDKLIFILNPYLLLGMDLPEDNSAAA